MNTPNSFRLIVALLTLVTFGKLSSAQSGPSFGIENAKSAINGMEDICNMEGGKCIKSKLLPIEHKTGDGASCMEVGFTNMRYEPSDPPQVIILHQYVNRCSYGVFSYLKVNNRWSSVIGLIQPGKDIVLELVYDGHTGADANVAMFCKQGNGPRDDVFCR